MGRQAMTEPKYGEPWEIEMRGSPDGPIALVSQMEDGRRQSGIYLNMPKDVRRAITSVNACASMSDPAAEIAAMREIVEAVKNERELNIQRENSSHGRERDLVFQEWCRAETAVIVALAAYDEIRKENYGPETA